MSAKKPGTPQTRIGHNMRELGAKLREEGRIDQALQAERAGADVDMTAASLGIRGERVKTTGAYYKAASLYRHITGNPYEG